jgi:hypothetical protein
MKGHTYTTEQLDWLRDHRAALGEGDLAIVFADRFGAQVTKKALSQRARKAGARTSGGRGRFEKGFRPWNTGRKGMPASAGFQSAQFRLGSVPHTYLPLWSYAIRSGYWAIKVRDDAPTGYSRQDWEFLHRLTWQDHHGPIPEGHVVVMTDGDIDHCQDPANLLCIPRAALVIAARLRLSTLSDPAQRRAAWEVVRLWAAAHALGRSGGLSHRQRVDLMGILAPFAPPPAAPPQDPATARRDAAARAVRAHHLAARGLDVAHV